jgi:glycosyltransferase involved in cell wall biosynthesis
MTYNLKKMKRILHISKYYPPYKGGIEDMAYSMVNSLSNNYEQTVLCFNNEKYDKIDFIDKVEVYRIGTTFKISSQPISLKIYFKMKQFLEKIKPDIIHFHAPNPLMGAILLYLIPKDCKLIIHWHGDIESRIKIYLFYKPFEIKLLQRAQKIIITSPNYMHLSSVLKPFEKKIFVIPNVINDKKLEITNEDESVISFIQKKFGEKIVFAFGRHVQYKGIEYLIKSESFIKSDCNIVIAGSGPLTEKLKTLNNSSRIHFIGHITDDELRQYLRASSIFAFPSISRGEAFGIALAEAMYCKLPSVTFTIEGSGVNWVCPNNISCLEVENMNYKAYAQAIDKLLIDTELRNKLACNAHEQASNNFTLDTVKNKILYLYSNL